MRLLGKVALGGGLASAATATWLVTAGVFATSATLVALDPVAPQAEARALRTFDSCETLLDWYVDNAVADVGPYGWNSNLVHGYGPWFQSARLDLSATVGLMSAYKSPTGTNTQETAVDEPDIAKTNGTLIARIVDDKRLVLIDVSGAEPTVTARLLLPRGSYGGELLLAEDRVLIFQQVYAVASRTTAKAGRRPYYGPGQEITRTLEIDISDPANPRLVHRDRYNGRLLSARQYADTIRVVTATNRPELDWVYPTKSLSRREATGRNRALVRRTTIEDWLPTVTRDGVPGQLIECDDILHPEKYAGSETVVVTTFPASATDQRSAVAVTAGGGLVYSSTDRLYVATQDYPSAFADMAMRPTSRSTTSIHAFDLTQAATSYLGSGDINGSLRDRWSLDEYDGRLRVAWTRTGPKGGTRNGITVLTERDGALEPTATIDNLGIDEDIQSVRWFDKLAVLVTFRQVDPLYTVDLADPDHPKVLGELKIPGYSGYLHPIGNDLVLGLGMSGNDDGLTGGAQAAVFDLSNPKKPVRVSQRSFGRDTYFQAIDDPRAFTWIPATSTAVTALSDWSDSTARMLALDVDGSGKLTTRTLADLNREWQARSFDLAGGRVAVLDQHRVRLINR